MQEQWFNIIVVSSLLVLFVGWLTTVLVERSLAQHTRFSYYIVTVCVLTTIGTLLLLLIRL